MKRSFDIILSMIPPILKQNSIILLHHEAWMVKSHLHRGQSSDTYLVHNDLHLPFIVKAYHPETPAMARDVESYETLKALGVMMPLLLHVEPSQRMLVKQYLNGDTVAQMLKKQRLNPLLLSKMKDLADYLKNKGVMLDYHPENFIVSDTLIYYVDYTCLPYDSTNDFDHVGLALWQDNV